MKTFDVLLFGLLISCENLVLLGTSVARLNLSNSPNKTSLSLGLLDCSKMKLRSGSSRSAYWL